jgi:hypothetical protein
MCNFYNYNFWWYKLWVWCHFRLWAFWASGVFHNMLIAKIFISLFRWGLLILLRILVVILKQWPLDSEFIEFEYSPEICHFWRIRVLAKMAFFRNVPDSPDSQTFASLVCSDSPDSTTFANLVCLDSPESRKPSFASITRIWRVWRVWQI